MRVTVPRHEPPRRTALQTAQHQLRNKLSVVMGSIDIVDLAEPLSPDGKRDVARAKQACAEIGALVDRLSDLSSSGGNH
jgi:signal transduction histidine kinase